MRTRAWRRVQRKRMIRRRLNIISAIWYFTDWPPPGKAGRLAKWNLVCSCGMCRQPKFDRRKDLPPSPNVYGTSLLRRQNCRFESDRGHYQAVAQR